MREQKHLLTLLALPFMVGLLLLPVAPAQALTCPVSPGYGINCSTFGPQYSYCGTYDAGGQCLIESSLGCPNDGYGERIRIDCPTCSCACPTARSLDCVDQTAHTCQTPNTTCDTQFRYHACAPSGTVSDCGSCKPGYVQCNGPTNACSLVVVPSYCKAPDTWDQCAGKCVSRYVLTDPPAEMSPQPAQVSLEGNFSIYGDPLEADAGNFYLSNGKAIRVDDQDVSSLSLGNWHTSATGFHMYVFGSIFGQQGMSMIPGDDSIFAGTTPGNGVIEADEICLDDDSGCRESWPIGLPEFAQEHSTLRYDGGVWEYDNFLKNYQPQAGSPDEGEKWLGVGLEGLTETPGWPLDIRMDSVTPKSSAILNLTDEDGSLWTGFRLARKLLADDNKERWFFGMPSGANDDLVVQYDGDVNKRYLNVLSSGRVGIGTQTPQTKLGLNNGQFRINRTDGFDPAVQMTSNITNQEWNLGQENDDGSFRLSQSFADLDSPVLTVGGTGYRYLGLNTASPGYPLDVFSSAGTAIMRLTDDNGTNNPGLWTGMSLARWPISDKVISQPPTEKWFVGMPKSGEGGNKFFIRRDGTTNDLTIDTAGLFGLGQESPQAKLHVSGGNLRLQSEADGDAPVIGLDSNEANADWAIGPLGSDAGQLIFGLGLGDGALGTPALTVDRNGWIGSVTAQPNDVIDISNINNGSSTILNMNQTFAGNEAMGMSLERQGNPLWHVGMLSGSQNFRINDASTPADRLVIDANGNFGFNRTPDPTYMLDADGGRLRIRAMQVTHDVDGNPPPGGGSQYMLVAKNTDGDIVWEQKPLGLPRSGNVNGMTIRYNGGSNAWEGTTSLFNSSTRIGINEEAPGYPLDISPVGSDEAMIRLNGPSSGKAWTGIRMDRPEDNEKWFVGMDSATATDDLLFQADGSDRRLVIKGDDGKVGIGDVSPNSLLSVGDGDRFEVDGATGHISIGGGGVHPSDNAPVTVSRVLNTAGSDYGINASVTSTAADGGSALGGARLAATVQSAGVAGDLYGVEASALSNAAGMNGRVYGGDFLATVTNGNPASAYGVRARLNANPSGTTNITDAYGVSAVVDAENADTTYGGYFSADGGTVQDYGVYSALGNNYFRNWIATGAGNTVPDYPIDIYSDGGNAQVRIDQSSASAMRQGLKLDKDASETWFIGMQSGEDDLELVGANTSIVMEEASGHVGVNKADPEYTLDVAGTVNMTGVRMAARGYGTGMVLTSNADGEGYWETVVYADDCTGGKFSHLSSDPGKVVTMGNGGSDGLPVGSPNGVADGYTQGDAGDYAAFNAICGFEPVSGKRYHVCYADEILRSIRCAGAALPANGSAWVANGPPGYIGVAANDCKGWTSNAGGFVYGSYWEFNGQGGGVGWSTPCSTTLPVACCTPL